VDFYGTIGTGVIQEVRSAPRSWIPWVGVMLPVLALLGLLAAGTVRHQQALAVGEALARGETPKVPTVTLPGLDGPAVALAGLEGHPVVLNFWASWCVPCREEAPRLELIWRAFHDKGLIVLGVDTQDLDSPARAFVAQYGITFPTVRDPTGGVARLFGATGVPETFFIGADGRIRGKFPGEVVDSGVWRAAAAALLAGRAHVP
jgi:cytochrome c biogenesis protein CcmG, thiol:disulfide interchange protein DsbE